MEQVVRVHDWPGFLITRGSITVEFSGLLLVRMKSWSRVLDAGILQKCTMLHLVKRQCCVCKRDDVT